MLNRKNLKRGAEYPQDQVSHLLDNKYEQRKKRPMIESFDQFESETQSIYRSIVETLKKIDPDAVFLAVGSRINGNWNEESDYDLSVLCSKESYAQMQKLLKTFNFKVDLMHIYGIPIA